MSEYLQNILGVMPDHASYLEAEELPSNTKVGVEVELENVLLKGDERMKFWQLTRDGSLRDNGIEFVMANPTCGQTLLDAFKELDVFLKDKSPEASDRTSTHVHLDFRDSSVDQTFQFCMLYAIFEKTLFKYAGGAEREDSIYCIPLYKSYDAMSRIARLNERAVVKAQPKNSVRHIKREVQYAVSHAEKYAAMNIRPLGNFGSIEIRLHKGETDSTKILKWVKILLTMKKYTDNVEIDFEQLFNEMSYSGCAGLLDEVFGVNDTLEYFANIENKEEDLAHGLRVAQDIFNIWKMSNRNKGMLPAAVVWDGENEHPLKKKKGRTGSTKNRIRPAKASRTPNDPYAAAMARVHREDDDLGIAPRNQPREAVPVPHPNPWADRGVDGIFANPNVIIRNDQDEF